MVRLESMTDEDFADYLRYARAAYGESMVRGGFWHAGEAPELAEKTIRDLLSEGVDTPGHHFYSILREEADARTVVGYAWLGEADRGQGRYAYVYDFVILGSHRRRGYGKAALARLEDEVSRLGLNMIVAHVYSENFVARALYDTIGYTVDEVTLVKCVD